MIDYRTTRFILGAHQLSDLPEPTGVEIAIAGRSNVGKSSALNAITGVNGLAKTSKQPGRTRQINIFELIPGVRLVDLPGYGYAKVSAKLKRHWARTLVDYMLTRSNLAGLVLLMDARRPLSALDCQMLDWCAQRQFALHCLLTKSDKLSRGQSRLALMKVEQALADHPLSPGVQLFSSLKRQGVAQARTVIEAWLSAKV